MTNNQKLFFVFLILLATSVYFFSISSKSGLNKPDIDMSMECDNIVNETYEIHQEIAKNENYKECSRDADCEFLMLRGPTDCMGCINKNRAKSAIQEFELYRDISIEKKCPSDTPGYVTTMCRIPECVCTNNKCKSKEW